MKEKGMGRTRLGRFALITVPAVVATAGLGVAVVEGMVSATISSANGFQLASTGGLSTDSLKLRPGDTSAGSKANTSAVATAYAETGDHTSLDGMCLGVTQAMPSVVSALGLSNVGLKVAASGTIATPDVSLNAASLKGGSTHLDNVSVGQSQDTAHFADKTEANGYQPDGFGLVSTASVSDPDTISNLRAQSYAVTLSGLDLTSGLSISVDPNPSSGECF